MSGIIVKEEDNTKKLLKIEKIRFMRMEGLSPHHLDPAGAAVYYLLEIAERYFGKKAREELEEVLLPRQRVRILCELQKASLEEKLELIAARRIKRSHKREGKSVKEKEESVEEEDSNEFDDIPI